MIDIYLVTSILNLIWYIFSIVFVLYKFTSFFSYIYGCFKFAGKLFEGILYLKDHVHLFFERRRGHYVTRAPHRESVFTRIKKGMYYMTGYTHLPSEPILPLYDVRSSTMPTMQDRSLFDEQIGQVMQSASNEHEMNEDSFLLQPETTKVQHCGKHNNSFISVDFATTSLNIPSRVMSVDSNLLFQSSVINKHLCEPFP